MKRYFPLILIIWFTFSCSQKKDHHKEIETTPTILVYGKDDCGSCSQFKEMLDEEHLSYIFIDIDKDKDAYQLMVNKLREQNKLGAIKLPIVDISGKIMISPTLEELKNAL